MDVQHHLRVSEEQREECIDGDGVDLVDDLPAGVVGVLVGAHHRLQAGAAC